MHEPPKRQLFSVRKGTMIARGLCLVMGLVFGGQLSAGGNSGNADEVHQELQAALVAQNSVLKVAMRTKNPVPQQDMDKLAAMYEEIVNRHPNNVDALVAYGEYLWQIERREEAMGKWTKAQSLAPDNASVVNHLGECQLALGHTREATLYFERATKMDPKIAVYQFNAGNTCFLFRHEITTATDNTESIILRSLDHFREAAKLEPFNVDYALAYAESFYGIQKPNWGDALDAWNHYLKITAEKDFAYSNLARVHLKLGNKEEAREDLTKIENEKFRILKERLQHQIDTIP